MLLKLALLSLLANAPDSLRPRLEARIAQLERELTALARHYGLLPAPDVDARIRRHLRHWGAPDYRPALEPRGS